MKNAQQVPLAGRNSSIPKAIYLSFAALCSLSTPDLYARSENPVINIHQSNQNEKVIKGTIIDENKEPMIGVSVSVKGTTIGTTTDIDGKFSLALTKEHHILNISYIGYTPQTVNTQGKTTLDITMHPDTRNLEEVVVVGYGTVKKRDLTGSVVSVKSEDITVSPTNNVMEALQGRVSGMDIMKTSGQVGSNVEILLRGSRTIYGSNQPLFIIDGVTGSYDQINPSDIESIDVLKDASTTAIYGSAGANGVVIITTKQGKAGKTNVNFDAYYGFSGNPDYKHGMIGDEWTAYRREAYKYQNGQYPADISAILSGDKLDAYHAGKWIDWVDQVAGNTATNQKYTLSVSGGSEKTRFFSSFLYDRQEGLLSNEKQDRYGMRINVDQKIFAWAKIGMTSNLTYTNRHAGVKNTFTNAITAFPLGDPYDDQGMINHEYINGEYSPLGDFIENQFVNQSRSVYANPTAYLEIMPIKDLSIKSVINVSLANTRLGQFWGAKCNANRPSYAGSPHASVTNSYEYGYTWDNIISYNKQINENHSLSATFLTTWSENINESNMAAGSGQNLDSWSFYRLMAATSQHIESDYSRRQKMSYAGRINYTLKDKYLLTLTARYDGVSFFSEGNKWDLFPAGALAWRISEESFMSGSKNWLDNLKLRASYGITGNDGALGAYITSSQPYAYSENGITIDGKIVPFTQYSGTYGNPGLGWEKSYNTNIGIDFGIFNSRINGSIEYFRTYTKDLLFKRTMPITSGITGWGRPLISWQNIAETSNKGVEITLNSYNIQTKDFTWSTALTFTWGNEKIESLPDGNLIKESLFEGKAIRSLYDFKYAGIWGTGTSSEDLEKYKVKPGYVMISTVEKFTKDENGNPIGDKGQHAYSDDDKQVLGHVNPDYIVGLNNTLRYKNLDLTLFAMGRFGQTICSDLIGRYSATTSNQISGVDYWREDNQNAYYPVPGSGSEGANKMSALRYRDGSFIKIKNITLGYTLPAPLSRKIMIEKLRVYATTYNPFLYVKDKQLRGTDPESNGSDAFPLYKQFVFGINLSF